MQNSQLLGWYWQYCSEKRSFFLLNSEVNTQCARGHQADVGHQANVGSMSSCAFRSRGLANTSRLQLHVINCNSCSAWISCWYLISVLTLSLANGLEWNLWNCQTDGQISDALEAHGYKWDQQDAWRPCDYRGTREGLFPLFFGGWCSVCSSREGVG